MKVCIASSNTALEGGSATSEIVRPGSGVTCGHINKFTNFCYTLCYYMHVNAIITLHYYNVGIMIKTYEVVEND